MLAGPQLMPTYLLLDALDECQDSKGGRPGIQNLLNLISDSIKIPNAKRKVKWILSSPPEVDIYNKLKNRHASDTILELDVHARKEPVQAYMKYKLSEMKRDYSYSNEILAKMSIEISKRTQNTFLWVALVFKDLIYNNVSEYDAPKRVKESSNSLNQIYNHIMHKIEQGSASDQKFCKDVLAATCMAYRPLTYTQLHALSGLPAIV